MTGDATADAAVDWLGGAAHTAYNFVVALYSRGFGAEHAHTVVGGLLLAIFGLATAIAAWYVFREVAEIGFKMLRVVLMLGVVALMVSLLSGLFVFVFPSESSRAAARAAARQAAEHASDATTSYLFGDVWSAVFGARAK